ncbi:pimeloyl-ACP methyl ester carboxylesterase [Actinoplanes tereljensis]|uniref:Peptidase n=1 Tax=Paractinoplanes tereljensis TaxID=571912 RepID=A0A919TVG8_9ACTN|nr:alpha/beta hydrolase [Actinoplanes tereljensis]GIF23931.1 peptidase [Actinoplanes tereljensis]
MRPFIAALTGVTLALTAAIAAPGAATAATSGVPWAACTEANLAGFECATREVPLDYDKPRGATTTIALARRPADDPAHKIGTIFVNPGGPGGAGRGMVVAAAAGRIVGPDVLARFDIVGFDPRGIGASDPVQCFPTDAEAEALFAQMRLVPLSRAEISSTIRANLAYTDGCVRNAGPLLEHMSTLNVAKDLDQLRQAVGDRKLNYIGYSYGTLIGATYANLFPSNVRAVVIDGNVDPDQRTNHRMDNKFERAGGFEIVLSAFLSECDKAGANCAFAGDARTKFDALRDRLRQGPAEVPDLGGTVTIDDLTDFISGTMYNIASWPDAAVTLQIAYDAVLGGGAPAALAARPFPKAKPGPGWSADDYLYNGNDSFLAVNCADTRVPRDPAAYPGIAARFEKASPTFGRAEAFGEVACANWPLINERYHGPWNRRTANTVLVVNPTHDPATRYDFAVRMTRELGNARLLTLDGYGHTTRYSACITGWYSRYLIDGALPPAGTHCQQDRAPFPAAP